MCEHLPIYGDICREMMQAGESICTACVFDSNAVCLSGSKKWCAVLEGERGGERGFVIYFRKKIKDVGIYMIVCGGCPAL